MWGEIGKKKTNKRENYTLTLNEGLRREQTGVKDPNLLTMNQWKWQFFINETDNMSKHCFLDMEPTASH